MGAKKQGPVTGVEQQHERRSSRPPDLSESRVRTAKKWSPTLRSAASPAQSSPDALAEAHAHAAEARAALDALVLALDRIKRR